MKNNYYAILLLLIGLTSCTQKGNMREFGLKGPVKEITNQIVNFRDFENPDVIDDKPKSYYTEKIIFDDQGNVTAIESSFSSSASFNASNTNVMKISYKDGKREAFKTKFKEDELGSYTSGKYVWLNDHHYQMVFYVDNSDRTDYISDVELDDDFRVKKRKFMFYEGGKPSGRGFVEVYEYHSDGTIKQNTHSTLNNDEKDNTATQIFHVQERDDYGNITKANSVDEKTGKKVMEVETAITYY